MKTLCLDAGNTRLKWGLHDGARWLGQGVLMHDAIATLAAQLPAAPERILACNVAGSAIASRIEALGVTLASPLVWFRSTQTASGVTNGYDRPEQLGADRWAALIGAHSLHPGPAIVVMAGTATTIDALDGHGRFLGGLILPGLDLMLRSLHLNTAGLPAARGDYRPLPRNTDDAIVSGAIHATLGAISRIGALLEGQPACLLSGGAAESLAAHISEMPLRRIDHLVLEGLAQSAATAIW
jgi:type III pantothenate kinase